MSLVTLANYKAYLNIASDDITKDIDLAVLINSVESRIKEYLNRDLEWSAYTDELYHGNGKRTLILRQYPILYVSAIKVYEGIVSGAESWTTLAALTDYDRLVIDIVRGSYEVFLDGYCFVKGYNNYKITYYAGYTTGETLVTGSMVVGKKYRILAHSIVDFTTKGSSSNTVGTEFVATATATMTASDSVIELLPLPYDIEEACKELLKITYANSPISGDNRLGFLSISSNAGGGSQNLNIDPDIEDKILKKIIRHKDTNV